MKYIYTILAIVIGIISITIASVFSNIDTFKTFLNQKGSNERNIYIESIMNQDTVIETIIDAAEKSKVTLTLSVVNPDQPLEVTYYVHFASQPLLDTILVTPSIDYSKFNALNTGISNINQSNDYRLDVIENNYKIEFLPFHLLMDNNKIGSISVSADNPGSLDLFLTKVNESGNLSILLVNNENNYRTFSGFSNFMLIFYMMFTNEIMVVTLLLLGILIVFRTYQSQRIDTIKILNGYSANTILRERLQTWLLTFFVTSLAVYPLLFVFIIKDFRFFGSVFKYYIQASFVVSVLIIFVLFIMQISLLILKPIEIIKNKRNSIILPSIIALKIVLISIVFVSVVPDLNNTLELYRSVNYLAKNKDQLSEQYYIESSDSSIDVHSLFIHKSEIYYEALRDITYISNLIEDDDSRFGSIVFANNTYVNSLQLKTIEGTLIELNDFNNEVIITTQSQAKSVRNRLAISDFDCFKPINNVCAHVNVIAVDDNTILPILGKQPNAVKDNFIIRTGVVAETYVDYVFKASTEKEVNQLSNRLREVFADIPIKLVSFEQVYSEYYNYLTNDFFEILKTVIVYGILLMILIYSVYIAMYDQFKREIATRVLIGENTLSSTFKLFYPQLTISLMILTSWMFVLQLPIKSSLLVAVLIILVELISMWIFNVSLNKKVIKNIKGG